MVCKESNQIHKILLISCIIIIQLKFIKNQVLYRRYNLLIFNNFFLFSQTTTVIPLTQHLNFIFEKFNVSFNVKYVEYFKNIPSDRDVYEFKVIEEVNTFSMDIRVNSFAKNKEIYKMSNIDGCFFLKNTLSNRIFHNFYKPLMP